MNINDTVWVRLTEAGVKLWKEKWPLQHVHEDGRWFDIQLWSLMTLLGDSITMWGPQYIVGWEIATEKPKELGGFTPPRAHVVNPAIPPDSRLTRTEIFLRLVDSFCRQPGGFTSSMKNDSFPIGNMFAMLRGEAMDLHGLWGGK